MPTMQDAITWTWDDVRSNLAILIKKKIYREREKTHNRRHKIEWYGHVTD